MKYIEFVQSSETHAGRPIHDVKNKKSGVHIAQIFWYAVWRQFVVRFNPEAIFSHDCLADIESYLKKLNGDAK